MTLMASRQLDDALITLSLEGSYTFLERWSANFQDN